MQHSAAQCIEMSSKTFIVKLCVDAMHLFNVISTQRKRIAVQQSILQRNLFKVSIKLELTFRPNQDDHQVSLSPKAFAFTQITSITDFQCRLIDNPICTLTNKLAKIHE